MEKYMKWIKGGKPTSASTQAVPVGGTPVTYRPYAGPGFSRGTYYQGLDFDPGRFKESKRWDWNYHRKKAAEAAANAPVPLENLRPNFRDAYNAQQARSARGKERVANRYATEAEQRTRKGIREVMLTPPPATGTHVGAAGKGFTQVGGSPVQSNIPDIAGLRKQHAEVRGAGTLLNYSGPAPQKPLGVRANIAGQRLLNRGKRMVQGLREKIGLEEETMYPTYVYVLSELLETMEFGIWNNIIDKGKTIFRNTASTQGVKAGLPKIGPFDASIAANTAPAARQTQYLSRATQRLSERTKTHAFVLGELLSHYYGF
jgi:hypothetical protein